MDAGYWTIYWTTNEAPEKIPIQRDEIGLYDPSWKHRDGALTFTWHDGRVSILSLHAILNAEYTPAKEK